MVTRSNVAYLSDEEAKVARKNVLYIDTQEGEGVEEGQAVEGEVEEQTGVEPVVEQENENEDTAEDVQEEKEKDATVKGEEAPASGPVRPARRNVILLEQEGPPEEPEQQAAVGKEPEDPSLPYFRDDGYAVMEGRSRCWIIPDPMRRTRLEWMGYQYGIEAKKKEKKKQTYEKAPKATGGGVPQDTLAEHMEDEPEDEEERCNVQLEGLPMSVISGKEGADLIALLAAHGILSDCKLRKSFITPDSARGTATYATPQQAVAACHALNNLDWNECRISATISG